MIAYHYLQITTALHCKDVPALVTEIADGQLHAALRLAEHAAETNTALAVPMLNVCGDLELLLDMPEDAELAYRRAHRVGLQHEAGPAWSCRAAGIQGLFRGRLESAATCFHKLLDASVPTSLRLEGGILAALIFRETGPAALSWQILKRLTREVTAPEFAAWRGLIAVIAEDFVARSAVRVRGELPDEIHWQVQPEERQGTLDWIPARAPADEGIVARLLDARQRQLHVMEELAGGRFRIDCANTGLRATINPLLGVRCRQVLLLDYARAASAGRDLRATELLLAALQRMPASDSAAATDDCRRQYHYCLSRLKLMQGRPEESFAQYRYYAAAAVAVMQAQAHVAQRFESKICQAHAQVSDDISTRLPPRHRRAYLYMLANLHRADLTIAEVAEAIGVSERALQLAFKEYVDLSPREVLRRARMEKIRAELSLGETTTMDAARKFGVQSRAALVAGYRKYFEMTPSAALARA